MLQTGVFWQRIRSCLGQQPLVVPRLSSRVWAIAGCTIKSCRIGEDSIVMSTYVIFFCFKCLPYITSTYVYTLPSYKGYNRGPERYSIYYYYSPIYHLISPLVSLGMIEIPTYVYPYFLTVSCAEWARYRFITGTRWGRKHVLSIMSYLPLRAENERLIRQIPTCISTYTINLPLVSSIILRSCLPVTYPSKPTLSSTWERIITPLS